MKSASRKEKYEYQKEETMKKVMKLLNRLAAMIGLALLFSSCYTADAALPRKHRHHHHHRPKRGVIVVHRFASTDQVRTDNSIFNISLAMAESLHNNDYS